MNSAIRLFIKVALNFSLSLFAGLMLSVTAYAELDPPSSVARLSYFDGTVTFLPAGSDDWAYAYLNRPLTTGDRIWVDRGARSELHLGSSALRLGSETSLDLLALTDSNVQLKVTQGTLYARVRALLTDESIEIDTPNLAFALREPGIYRIDVDSIRNVTTITVRTGSGTAFGDNGNSFMVQATQQVQFAGTDLMQAAAMADAPYDHFDRWSADRDHREDASISARYVSREIIGYEELDAHGTWRQEPGYGAVWVPTVTVVNWAPYRYGHWTWVAPWGWTWVDDQPWGFAPCHYGRWAWIRNSWAWVPGPLIARPVYAPALVAFASGGGGGASWGVSLSSGAPGVAWFPLAPGEVYRPAFAASPRYVTNINKTINITNVNVTNNITRTVYVNQQVSNAITGMPAAAFVKGQPVQKAGMSVYPGRWGNGQVNFTPALAPIKQSLLGNTTPAKVIPPRVFTSRPVMATKAVAEPAAFHDELAQKFANQNGTAPGGGPAIIHLSNRPSVMPTVSVIKGNAHAESKPAPLRSDIGSSNPTPPNHSAAGRNGISYPLVTTKPETSMGKENRSAHNDVPHSPEAARAPSTVIPPPRDARPNSVPLTQEHSAIHPSNAGSVQKERESHQAHEERMEIKERALHAPKAEQPNHAPQSGHHDDHKEQPHHSEEHRGGDAR